MLRYALMFFAIAIVAGLLGFGGVMGTTAWIARLFFFGFLIIAVISLVTGRRIRTDLKERVRNNFPKNRHVIPAQAGNQYRRETGFPPARE